MQLKHQPKYLVAILISLSLATVSCSRVVSRQISSLGGDAIAQAQADQAARPKTLVSKDGSTQLTVPANWEEVIDETPEPNLVLKVKSPSNEFQVGMQAFPKEKYPQINTDIATEAASDMAKAATGGSGTPQRTALTEINQLPVVQYEARGEFAGQPVAVLATMIESPDAYYTLLVVGYASDFEATRDELNQIVESFQEVKP